MNFHVVRNNVLIPVCFNAEIKCVYFLLSLFAALQVVWDVAVVLLVWRDILLTVARIVLQVYVC